MAPEGGRVGQWMARKTLPLELIAAFAGDRRLTSAERQRLEELKSARGDDFYSDLLFSLSHEYFPPSISESLWRDILRHKRGMSLLMKRNVRIAVAALDYLFNLKGQLRAPTVMDESRADAMTLLAVRDGLTRLFNHTACLQKVESEMNLYLRYGRVFSFMMLDLDDFKAVNDRYGHQEGDRLLTVLASLFQAEARDTDICCRYGGEEFALILPLTSLQEAGLLAERLRLLPILKLAPERVLTVSIGVTVCGPGAQTVQTLVEKADGALYQAKREGKNRVVLAP